MSKALLQSHSLLTSVKVCEEAAMQHILCSGCQSCQSSEQTYVIILHHLHPCIVESFSFSSKSVPVPRNSAQQSLNMF